MAELDLSKYVEGSPSSSPATLDLSRYVEGGTSEQGVSTSSSSEPMGFVERVARNTASGIAQIPATIGRVAGDIAQVNPAESQRTLALPESVPEGQRTRAGFEQRQAAQAKEAERIGKMEAEREVRREAVSKPFKQVSDVATEAVYPFEKMTSDLNARMDKAEQQQALGKRVGWVELGNLKNAINDAAARIENTQNKDQAIALIDQAKRANAIFAQDIETAPNKTIKDKAHNLAREIGTVVLQMADNVVPAVAVSLASGGLGALGEGAGAVAGTARVLSTAGKVTAPLMQTGGVLQSTKGEVANQVIGDLESQGVPSADIKTYVDKIPEATNLINTALENAEIGTAFKSVKGTATAEAMNKVLAGLKNITEGKITAQMGKAALGTGWYAVKEAAPETMQGLNASLASLNIRQKMAEDGKGPQVDESAEIKKIVDGLPSDFVQNLLVVGALPVAGRVLGGTYGIARKTIAKRTATSPEAEVAHAAEPTSTGYNPVAPEEVDVGVPFSEEPLQAAKVRNSSQSKEAGSMPQAVPQAQAALEEQGQRVVYGVPESILEAPQRVSIDTQSVPSAHTKSHNQIGIVLKQNADVEEDPVINSIMSLAENDNARHDLNQQIDEIIHANPALIQAFKKSSATQIDAASKYIEKAGSNPESVYTAMVNATRETLMPDLSAWVQKNVGTTLDKSKYSDMVKEAFKAPDLQGIRQAVVNSGIIPADQNNTINSVTLRLGVIKRMGAQNLIGTAVNRRDSGTWTGNMADVDAVLATPEWVDRNKAKVDDLVAKGIKVIKTPDMAHDKINEALNAFRGVEPEQAKPTIEQAVQDQVAPAVSKAPMADETVQPTPMPISEIPSTTEAPAPIPGMANAKGEGTVLASKTKRGISAGSVEAKSKAAETRAQRKAEKEATAPKVEVVSPIKEETAHAPEERVVAEDHRQEHRRAGEEVQGNGTHREQHPEERGGGTEAGHRNRNVGSRQVEEEEVKPAPAQEVKPTNEEKPHGLQEQGRKEKARQEVSPADRIKKKRAIQALTNMVRKEAKRVGEAKPSEETVKRVAKKAVSSERVGKTVKRAAKSTLRETPKAKKNVEHIQRKVEETQNLPRLKRTNSFAENVQAIHAMAKDAYAKRKANLITRKQYREAVFGLAGLKRKYLTEAYADGYIDHATYAHEMAKLPHTIASEAIVDKMLKKHPELSELVGVARGYIGKTNSKLDIAKAMRAGGYTNLEALNDFTAGRTELSEFIKAAYESKQTLGGTAAEQKKYDVQRGSKQQSPYTNTVNQKIIDIDSLLSASEKNLEPDLEVKSQEVPIRVQRLTNAIIKNYLPRFYSKKQNKAMVELSVADQYKWNGKTIDLKSKGAEGVVYFDPMSGKVHIIVSPDAVNNGSYARILAHELLGHVGIEYVMRKDERIKNQLRGTFNNLVERGDNGIKELEDMYSDQLSGISSERRSDFLFSEWLANSMDAFAINEQKKHRWASPVPTDETFLGRLMRNNPDLYMKFVRWGGYAYNKFFKKPLEAILSSVAKHLGYTKGIDAVMRDMLYSNAMRDVHQTYAKFGTMVAMYDPFLAPYRKYGAEIDAAVNGGQVMDQIQNMASEAISTTIPSLNRIMEGVQGLFGKLADGTIEASKKTELMDGAKSVVEKASALQDILSNAIDALTVIRQSITDSPTSPAVIRLNTLEHILRGTIAELNTTVETLNEMLATAYFADRGDMPARMALLNYDTIANAAKAFDDDVVQAAMNQIEHKAQTPDQAKQITKAKYKYPTGLGAMKVFLKAQLVNPSAAPIEWMRNFAPEINETERDPNVVHDTEMQRTISAQDRARKEYERAEKIVRDAGMEPAAFSQFITYRHALERNAKVDEKNNKLTGRGSGISNAEAIAYMKRLKENRPSEYSALMQASEIARQIAYDTARNLRTAGLISDATFSNITNSYPYYVPLKDTVGDASDIDTPYASAMDDFAAYQGMSQHKKPIHRALGRSTRPDIEKSWARLQEANMASLFAVNRSEVMHNFYKVVEDHQHPNSPMVVGIPQKVRATFDKQSGQVKYRKGNISRLGEIGGEQYAVITVMFDGKPKYITVKGDPLIKYFEGYHSLDGFMGNVAKLVRTMTMWSSISSTLLSPSFTTVDFNRNLQDASHNITKFLARKYGWGTAKIATMQTAIYARLLKDTVANTPAAISYAYRHMRDISAAHGDWRTEHITDKDARFEELRRIGAATEMRSSYSANAALQRMNLNSKYANGEVNKMVSGAMSIGHAVGSTLEGVDLALRLSVHDLLMKEGKSLFVQKDGTVNSRMLAHAIQDNTMNFGRLGHFVSRVWSAFTPFIKVMMQANYKYLSELFKTKSGKVLFAKSMATGFAMTMLGSYLMKAMNPPQPDDPENEEALNKWNNIPWYIKRMGLVLPMPHGKYVSAYMGTSWGVAASLGVAIAEAYNNVMRDIRHGINEKDAIESNAPDLAMKTASALSMIYSVGGDPVENGQFNWASLLPPITGLTEVQQYMSNKNFAGSSIHPISYNENIPHAYQYYDNASAISRNMASLLNTLTEGSTSTAGKINLYPNDIDWVTQSVFKSMGRDVGQALDMTVGNVQRYAHGEQLNLDPSKMPILARWIRTIPPAEMDKRWFNYQKITKNLGQDASVKMEDIMDRQKYARTKQDIDALKYVIDVDKKNLLAKYKWNLSYYIAKGNDKASVMQSMVKMPAEMIANAGYSNELSKIIADNNEKINDRRQNIPKQTSMQMVRQMQNEIKVLKEDNARRIIAITAIDRTLERMWMIHKKELTQ